MTGTSGKRVLILVPARSAHEPEPLFLSPIGEGHLIDQTLRVAERIARDHGARICVTTDDPRVGAHVLGRDAGWHVRRREAREIAGDYFTVLEVAHRWMVAECRTTFDMVLILEPTHPFRPTGLVDNALAMMARDDGLDSVVSVVREYGNIWTEGEDGALHRLTTPSGRCFYREVAGLCLVTRPATLGAQKAMGRSVGFVVVEEQWALIDIHGADGIALARRYHDLLAPDEDRA